MKKTNISEFIDDDTRNIYNNAISCTSIKKEYGLTRSIVEKISKEKGEDSWVLDIRLKALDAFYKMDDPDWGPDVSYLDLSKLATYVKTSDNEVRTWDLVPDDIRKVFDRLGIPDAEKESLYGSGAQFDSEIVYHNLY